MDRGAWQAIAYGVAKSWTDWQLRHRGDRGDHAIELTDAVPSLLELPLKLCGEALEARGQAAVGHMELLDEVTGPGQSPSGQHLCTEGVR